MKLTDKLIDTKFPGIRGKSGESVCLYMLSRSYFPTHYNGVQSQFLQGNFFVCVVCECELIVQFPVLPESILFCWSQKLSYVQEGTA